MGSSNIYTGVLTKEMVLDTVGRRESVTAVSHQRMIGGSMHHRAASIIGRMARNHKKQVIAAGPQDMAGVMSGSGMSGGGLSGGAHIKHRLSRHFA